MSHILYVLTWVTLLSFHITTGNRSGLNSYENNVTQVKTRHKLWLP